MPKFFVDPKFKPSALSGLAVTTAGNLVQLSLLPFDAEKVASMTLAQERALEDMYALDPAVDGVVTKLGGIVQASMDTAINANALLYLPFNETSGNAINYGSLAASVPSLTPTNITRNGSTLKAAEGGASYVFGASLNGSVSTAAAVPELLFPGLSSYSVSLWLQVDTLNVNSAYLVGTRRSGGPDGWLLYLNSSGVPSISRYNAGTASGVGMTSFTPTIGTSYHIGWCYDGASNTSRLLLNGVLNRTVSHAAIPAGIGTSTDQLKVGYGASSLGPAAHISDVTVVGSAMPDSWFRAQWAAGQYGPA